MKLHSMMLVVMLMALLSACIAPVTVAPAAEATGAQVVQDHGDHEHTMDSAAQSGEVDFPVSCTPEAQAAFNQGMAMLHSFWFPPAIEAFTTATELDPSCAMGHWGVAMSLLDIPWNPPSSQALEDGWNTVEKAKAVGTKTPREEAYIGPSLPSIRTPTPWIIARAR
jgi:hypothetical protein